MTIIGSGTVLSFLVAAISLVRFLKALTGPANVFLHIQSTGVHVHMNKKTPKEMYHVPCFGAPLLHTHTNNEVSLKGGLRSKET